MTEPPVPVIDVTSVRVFLGNVIDVLPRLEPSSVDAIVTDYSGVAVEAAAAGVACYYYIYDVDEYASQRGLNVDLREEVVGKYAFIDADTLAAQADFAGDDHPCYDYRALSSFAGKYIEIPLAGNTERLAAFIAGL